MILHRLTPSLREVERPADTEPDTTDRAMQRALEARYDGPVNVGASVSPDFAEPPHIQWRNRRMDEWNDVRRFGHLINAERHAWDATNCMTHQREIARLRASMKYALRNWAAFRDEEQKALADLERRQADSSTVQAKALGELFGGRG